MNPVCYGFFILILLSFSACLIKPPEPEPDPWTKLENYISQSNIRVLHATPDELYILSDDEFARLNKNNEFIEKRSFSLPLDFTGRSSISNHTFYQIILSDSSAMEINFQLTKTPGPRYTIKIDDYISSGDAALLPDGKDRNISTYNDDGTQFIIPVIQIPDSYYAFFLFDVKLNLANNNFEEISLAARINVSDFPANSGNLNSVIFIDGYYYATSVHGAIRIDPLNNSYEKVSDQWIIDVFKYGDKIYASGFNNLLLVSADNGLNFTALNVSDNPPKFQLIDVENGHIFSQQAIGFPFNLIESDFSRSRKVALNDDIIQDFSAFQDIEYFNGNYYLSVFRELYFSPEISTE